MLDLKSSGTTAAELPRTTAFTNLSMLFAGTIAPNLSPSNSLYLPPRAQGFRCMPASQVSFFFFFSTNANILNIYSLQPALSLLSPIYRLRPNFTSFESILLQVYSVSSVSSSNIARIKSSVKVERIFYRGTISFSKRSF